ncbi:MAG: hypothetical protein H7Y38_11145, partial [Armatimonadetes bacterium]|nr:hypothetical protein [Armatimonadota bacterium]
FFVLPLLVCVAAWLLSVPQWVRSLTTPALVADEYGVTDATGAVPGGLVYWNEIAAIETVETPAETLLLLRLHDTPAYLARLPEPTRQMLTGGASHYGTPCVVAQSDLAVSVGDAMRTLTEARARFVRQPIPVAVPVATIYDAPASTVAAPATTVSKAHWWTAVPPEERVAKPIQQVGRNGDR